MALNRLAPGNAFRVSPGTLGPGTRVAGARYLLKRLLGRGPFSEVWLARDREPEQDIALKFLPQTVREDAALMERLKQETRRSARLIHAGIARVYEWVHDLELVAVAMEYAQGWSLATLQVDRPQRRYGPGEIAPWIRQICAALAYAHGEIGLVHRDLKPSNLLLDAREQVKITDFSLAQTVREALTPKGQLTQGTLAYFSPQQIKGAEPSALDDVYSLGANIYTLLTGTPPFHAGKILAQVFELPPPSMTERLAQLGIHDSIPKAWEQTVAACLAKDPGRRPQSAGEVVEWLELGRPAAPQPETEPATVWEGLGPLLGAAQRRTGSASARPSHPGS